MASNPTTVLNLFISHILQAEDKSENVMRGIIVDKMVINISVGKSGDRLTYATRVLEQLTGQKPCHGRARYTVRQFSIRRNETISAYVTVRGDKALDLLERGLKVSPHGHDAGFIAAHVSGIQGVGVALPCVGLGYGRARSEQGARC